MVLAIRHQMQETSMTFETLTIPPPPPGPNDWNADGVVILKNFIPEDLMVAYENCWLRENSQTRNRPQGWPDCTPYSRHNEVKNLFTYKPLAEQIEALIGEPAGVHLNLTGWVSTQRDWHQDSYLNPPHVGDKYAAIWLALDTIHPDSGPFQYVPGSHRWPQVTREKILAALTEEERDHRWPKHTERILTPLFEAEIAKRGTPVTTHLPSRGDVLIWHGRLMHRGSRPNTPGMERRATIAHYSGIKHRSDMPRALQHNGQGWFFPINDGIQYGE
jgi:ectoine hydroxylase-related dioxygenase (phytanoyl-CoA dioxygenase family)